MLRVSTIKGEGIDVNKEVEKGRYSSTVGSSISRARSQSSSIHGRSYSRTRTSGDGMVGAEHANSGTELRSSERHHVLADMCSHNLPVLWVSVGEDVLDEIVAILIAGNVNKWDTWAIDTTFADSIEVASEKLRSAYLETLLDDLRGELVHAVLCSISDNMINGTAPICRGTMFAYMLDAPVTKLTVGDDINVGKDLFDTRSL
jgi:hypothetical protein